MLCYEGKAQIVQTNRKLGVKVTAQNGQRHEKYGEYALEFGINMALYSSEKVETSQPFINVVIMKTAGLIYCADGPQFSVVSPLLKYHNGLPRGRARSTVHFPGRLENKKYPTYLENRGFDKIVDLAVEVVDDFSSRITLHKPEPYPPAGERKPKQNCRRQLITNSLCLVTGNIISCTASNNGKSVFSPSPLLPKNIPRIYQK